MPTPTQRVQVLLKPEVLELVKQLSDGNGLSLSKQVSQLVLEALEARGLYSRAKRQGISSFIAEAAAQSGMTSTVVAKKTEDLEPNDKRLLQTLMGLDEADLGLLQKLKALQTAGLL
jgi:hypothetical protein